MNSTELGRGTGDRLLWRLHLRGWKGLGELRSGIVEVKLLRLRLSGDAKRKGRDGQISE